MIKLNFNKSYLLRSIGALIYELITLQSPLNSVNSIRRGIIRCQREYLRAMRDELETFNNPVIPLNDLVPQILRKIVAMFSFFNLIHFDYFLI